MNFQELDPNIIEPSPWNVNVVSHENEKKLKASIERHGMFKPLIVRQIAPDQGSGEIIYQCIGGWHRCEQAIRLGYKTVPVVNLGFIDDEQAMEVSLADNARYGVDDTLKLSELLDELDISAIEETMPWTARDIAAITAPLSVNLDDLNLDDPSDKILDDEPEDDKPARVAKTHTILRFRCTLEDAAKISNRIVEAQKAQGFTKDDDLTNAGDALAFILLAGEDDEPPVS